MNDFSLDVVLSALWTHLQLERTQCPWDDFKQFAWQKTLPLSAKKTATGFS